jgi:hypothetical protein
MNDTIFIVYGMDFEKWCDRYNIEPMEDVECHKCNKMQKINLPFFSKKIRGLTAEKCDCGHPFPPFTYVMIEGCSLFDL